jgi:hypothetical protein
MFLNGMERGIAKRESIKQKEDGKNKAKRGDRKGRWERGDRLRLGRPLALLDRKSGREEQREGGKGQRGEVRTEGRGVLLPSERSERSSYRVKRAVNVGRAATGLPSVMTVSAR